ncbi:MAG: peptidoglycan DD-metalloendopeptidase family protein [Desulfitobacterium hafniense]|nr:peptidoglycan DD-metalloendopeptidase family protein [Desulfitobacterium hafniense]
MTVVMLGTSIVPLSADELDDAIREQQRIKNQQDAAKDRLNQLTYTADRLKTQLEQLNGQITVAQTSLVQKQKALAEAEADVTKAQKELEQKQKDLENRRQSLQKRLRGIYVEGQVSYLEILFQAKDLGDFITRLEYFNKLVSNDQQLMAGIKSQKEQVEQKARELQERRDQAARIQAQAVAAKNELDGKQQQQKTALNQNKKYQDEIFVQMEKLEADANSLTDKIRQLQASRKGGVIGTVNTWPVPGYYEVSSPFGWRIHPITRKRSLHTGTDIPAPSGTKLAAAGDGVVIYSGWYGAYGNTVIIDHGGGYSTLYGHQSRVAASEGDQVKAGEVIGYVGSTGWSTGPHLHFEVRVGGNPTDPLQYFR